MAPPPEDVYCTMLLNDAYLPGAQVLAHSLRDGGTKYRLAVMVTLAGVSEETVTELKKLYDYVIPVEPVYSRSSANLHLMRRIDLHAALTKINLWNQTQFRKVVYVDADMVALRVPDELFDVEAEFAAVPDAGWPDCFNSGLMVCSPSAKTYGDLKELAGQGDASFDGADQGLLNQYFSNWHRLSFVYNCTVGGNMGYQYAPAFKHYGSNVSMAHFIGATKPWDRGNVTGGSSSSEPYDKLSGHWWQVYNKHHGYSKHTVWGGRSGLDYGKSVGQGAGGALPSDAPVEKEAGTPQTQIPVDEAAAEVPTDTAAAVTAEEEEEQEEDDTDTVIAEDDTVAEAPAEIVSELATETAATVTPDDDAVVEHEPKFVPIRSINEPSRFHENFSFHHYEKFNAEGRFDEYVMTKEGPVSQSQYFQTGIGSYHIHTPEVAPVEPEPVVHGERVAKSFTATYQDWDPTKSAPPQHGAPEADRLLIRPYENVWDMPTSAPFVAPAFVPPPAAHLWYDVPESSTSKDTTTPKTIFPWEAKPRQVTRVFNDTIPAAPQPQQEDVAVAEKPAEPAANPEESTAQLKPVFPWEEKPRTVTRVFSTDDDSNSQTEGASEYSAADEDDLPRSIAGSDGEWQRLVSRENRWDTDPAIREYVLGLRKRRSQVADDAPVASGAVAELPPITPNPVRRAAPEMPEDQDDEVTKEPEWDPEKKLEELRRLPPSLLSQLISKMQNTNVADEQDQGKSLTPKASMRFRSDLDHSDADLKAAASIPLDDGDKAPRRRSIDSALGSAIDD